MDEITQREIIFIIRGFHFDKNSESVNHAVAQLLNKLLIRFTRSRLKHTDDNGLVETKNGTMLHKKLEYVHIPQAYAESPLDDIIIG